MKNLRRRIELLEKRLSSDPILLEMPNGNTERILGHPSYVLELMVCSFKGERVEEMELIARSIRSHEPGGAHMVDVARLLHGVRHKQESAGEDAPGNSHG
jgi:hypothetical protein